MFPGNRCVEELAGQKGGTLADPKLGKCWLRAESERVLKKRPVAPPVPPLPLLRLTHSYFLLLPPTSRTNVPCCVAFSRIGKYPGHSQQLHRLLLLPQPRLPQGAILAQVALLLGTKGQGPNAYLVIDPYTSPTWRKKLNPPYLMSRWRHSSALRCAHDRKP